ncbi:MAG TPA: hypothetical protein VHV83_07525 [Armatimonadota bacterium]|nr:hypothetical protein [Armatimonadota bacterium]
MCIRQLLRNMCALLVLCLLTTAAISAPGWQATVAQQSGNMRLSYAGTDIGSLDAGLFDTSWNNMAIKPNFSDTGARQDGVYRASLMSNGVVIDAVTTMTPVPDGLHLVYTFTPQKDMKLNSLHVSLSVSVPKLLGGQYVADGVSTPFPLTYQATRIYDKPTSSFTMQFPSKTSLHFQFANAAQLLLQDNRLWSEDYVIRISPVNSDLPVWTGGKPYVIDMTLTTPGGFNVTYDKPVVLKASNDWIPLDTHLDIVPGSALDFSQIMPWHSPAGDYGRVMANSKGQFVFAKRPNEPVRFYGCNLCFSALYLSHEEADTLAARLQRLGYNAVRIHHYESGLVDRSKGDSVHFNANALDQLDYLFAALKKRGIYVTTDLFVSRPVFAKEVWDNETGDIEMTEYKMAALVNERAYENFITFSTNLLTHVNPYTGMRWADDPTLAWISLINEGNIVGRMGSLSSRLRPDWVRAWNAWLAARYPSRDALTKALGQLDPSQDPAKGTVPLPTATDETAKGKLLSCFLADTQSKLFLRTRAVLHEKIGCKALLTNMNMNNGSDPVQTQATRQDFDYVDDHFYVDHPTFLGTAWQLPSQCPNTSPVAAGAPGGRNCAFSRLLDKPFTITEFNYAGPGRFRGVGGMLTSAMGALQDWSGIWRFAYSHGRTGIFNALPMGYFDIATDPLNQAAERAAVCIFRRGDLHPARHSVGIVMSKDELMQSPVTAHSVNPGWNGMALVTKVGMQVTDKQHPVSADLALPLTGKAPAGSKGAKWFQVNPYNTDTTTKLFAEIRQRGWIHPKNASTGVTPYYQSENGELTVNGPADVFTLDTDRTAGGFAPAGTTMTLKAATITVEKTDATVWVSSLDAQSISTSGRLLITHLTDLQNTDMVYADQGKHITVSWGRVPYLVAAGSATVKLRLAHPEKAKVWGLATDGTRLQPITTRIENGMLVIPLDINAGGKARMLYEVELQK